MAILRIVFAVTILGAVFCSPATAVVAYRVTDLGPSKANGINNSGQVVGPCYLRARSFGVAGQGPTSEPVGSVPPTASTTPGRSWCGL